MEPIKPDRLTHDEVKAMSVWKLLKDIKPEHDDAWKAISTFKEGGDAVWSYVAPDAISQRLAAADLPVLCGLYQKFHDDFDRQRFTLSIDQPVREWSSVKKIFALCEVLGAYSDSTVERAQHRKIMMLQYALWQDDGDFAQYVMERGAHPNDVLQSHEVFYEARSGAMLQLLEKHGAKLPTQPDAQGYTLLHRACDRQNKADYVSFCLAKGMSVNTRDDYDRTPLMVLACSAFYEPKDRAEPKVLALIAAGADLSLTCKGKTIIELALAHKKHNQEGDPYYPRSVDRLVELIRDAQEKNKSKF